MSKFFQASLKKEKTLNISRENDPPFTQKRKNTKKFMISPVKKNKNDKNVISKEIYKTEKNYETNEPSENIYNEKHIFNIINKNQLNNNHDICDNNINIDNLNNFKQSSKFSLVNQENNINITPQFNDNKLYNCVSPLYSNTDTNHKNISSQLLYNDFNEFTDKNNLKDNLKKKIINDPFIQNINSELIEKETKNLEKTSVEIQQNTKINYTSINKLNFSSLQDEPSITYIQKDKIKLYNYNIMLDTSTKTFIKNDDCIPCFYCRRKFNFIPLGIPIKYYPSVYILNNNYLQICKYSFNYKENSVKLNKNERIRLLELLKNNLNFEKLSIPILEPKNTDENINVNILEENNNISIKNNNENFDIYNNKYHKILTRDFFETDSIVCSFNCMISFIEENNYNPLYQNSNHLMYLMYKHIFGYFPNKSFIRSPSWKLRKEYGGNLSNEDYEKFIQNNIPIIESKQTKSITNQLKSEIIFEILI
jgi:hypothetical protein